MKNIFKLLSVMFVAGAMMMVSCEKDPKDDPVNPDVKKYTITVTANNDNFGTVSGGGEYEANASATLTATPKEGYTFVNWNDGNTNNPRIITVTEDASYIANFEEVAGINVTFGNAQWSAGYTNAQMAPNAIMLAAAQTNATSYPQIRMYYESESNLATGNYTAGLTLDTDGQYIYFDFGIPYLWYFESTYLDFGTSVAGDWMSRNLTLQITALDLDNLTASMVANATMSHITDLISDQGFTSIDLDDCESRDLTVTVTNQQFASASKAMPTTKASVRVK